MSSDTAEEQWIHRSLLDHPSAPPISLAEKNRAARSGVAREIAEGLSAQSKWLPTRYLYDDVGSSIFEEICELPEYYLTRAEHEILERRAGEIGRLMPSVDCLVELGSGSASKTRSLIRAFHSDDRPVAFVPIDISRSALEQVAKELASEYPTLEVRALEAEYERGLDDPAAHTPGARLILWLGSSIGNLSRANSVEFLSGVAAKLGPNDRLLIGIDLRKSAAVLERAYDDSAGVTARFNLNLLDRINRELGGTFDVENFEFRARYLEPEGVVESNLVSRTAQTVSISGLDLTVRLGAGESIHTENSFKYSRAEIQDLARDSGMREVASWRDDQNRFNLSVFGRA